MHVSISQAKRQEQCWGNTTASTECEEDFGNNTQHLQPPWQADIQCSAKMKVQRKRFDSRVKEAVLLPWNQKASL